MSYTGQTRVGPGNRWRYDGMTCAMRAVATTAAATCFFIPAKARDYVFTGVGLSVCLFVTTITKYNVDGSGQNFLGRFLGGKASPSSFSVTIASRVWRLLSKKAVNRGFFPM